MDHARAELKCFLIARARPAKRAIESPVERRAARPRMAQHPQKPRLHGPVIQALDDMQARTRRARQHASNAARGSARVLVNMRTARFRPRNAAPTMPR